MEGIIWLLVAALTVIPLFKVLPHFGINQYWALIGIIPVGTIALLWWMAMRLQDLEKR